MATTDSGGLVTARVQQIHGAGHVARLLLDVPRRHPDISIHTTSVNGEPGLEARTGDTTRAVISVITSGNRITRLWIVRNPDKLTAWQPMDER